MQNAKENCDCSYNMLKSTKLSQPRPELRQKKETTMKKNLILIGMPGVGKSTIGVILAKEIGYEFIDADLVIQKRENRLLKDIIHTEGVDGFLEIENEANLSIQAEKAVIATGGSAVYGTEAMEHYKKTGTIIYLKCSYGILKKRLGDLKGRGVVLRPGQNLRSIYNERSVLYEKYADIIIEEENHGIEATLQLILDALQ